MDSLKTPRDISLLQLNKEEILVIACDSAGGIGQKTYDQIKVSNQIVGQYTVKVPLMEVMSVGAEVISVIDNLGVEYEPTGREIITGIKKNLKLLGKTELLNGSTEENVKTLQTALGVTVIAKVKLAKLKQYQSSNLNNIIVAAGLPLVGEKLLAAKSKAVDFKKFLQLKKLNYLDQILPVGSKGILHELNILAAENNLDFKLKKSKHKFELDLEKSAGPATVLLLSLDQKYLAKLKTEIELPITEIAEFK